MLYEKTLSRKIIGELAPSDKQHSSGGNLDGDAQDSNTLPDGAEACSKSARGRIRNLVRYLGQKFWKPSTDENTKQGASVGKIYNLMR